MNELTRILDGIRQGDENDSGQLLPLVYDELRRLASDKLTRERPGQTLQATALVHEAYLRVGGGDGDRRWENRSHFFAAAAEAMRRILIDQARHKKSVKAGGGMKRVPLGGVDPSSGPEGASLEELLALDEALSQLEAEDPVKAKLVKLRYFTGTSLEETASLLGISPATAKRHWAYSRAWLYGRMNRERAADSDRIS